MLPVTQVHMLSNGRRFADRGYAAKVAQVRHPDFMVGIPLYSDVASHHDFVVSMTARSIRPWWASTTWPAVGFDRSPNRASQADLGSGCRSLPNNIYRYLPFVEHVALMGLEMMGYTKMNLKTLWIDPFDYQDALEEAVSRLALRGMNVSIYNISSACCASRCGSSPASRYLISRTFT
jgi:hypothetical protein